jgi:small-conductance mechanosensitive channel
MSEEGESINENINLSSEKEAAPEVLENESEIEEPLGGQGEQLEAAAIEQPLPSQLEVQAKPKKQKSKATINKIQKSLADTSNQIVKQRTQINKINQNLQSLQKQMKVGERQTRTVNQIRS